jgi:hypothetical protein
LHSRKIMLIFVSHKTIELMATRKLDRDELRDIAIEITNELITLGFVPDCTDTDDESEFNVQDTIVKILKSEKLFKKCQK